MLQLESGGRISSTSYFLLRPSTDCARPTHIIEDNLLYSKSTSANINLVLKTPSQQHLEKCLAKYLCAVA